MKKRNQTQLSEDILKNNRFKAKSQKGFVAIEFI